MFCLKEKTWSAETVIKIPSKKVEGWALPEMPGGWVIERLPRSNTKLSALFGINYEMSRLFVLLFVCSI